jgi:hypothetical protein
VNGYNGSLWCRDRLADPTELPILIPEQELLDSDPTRGFNSMLEYNHWLTSIREAQRDLTDHIEEDIVTYVRAPTREEITNRYHILLNALRWHEDMGPLGFVFEATATPRNESNQGVWGGVGTYSAALDGDGFPDIAVDSSIEA